MNLLFVIFYIAILVFAVALIAILLRLLYIEKLNPNGTNAYKHTNKTLRQFALLRGFCVLENLSFGNNGTTIPIQTILVGHFGILFVHTCGARGSYYGEVDSSTWIFLKDSIENISKTEVPNPLLAQEKAINLLRKEFGKQKIYNISTERAVVVSNPSKKTNVYITNDNLIFSRKKFNSYIKRSKFERETGLDIDKVSKAILACSQPVTKP